MPSVNFEFRDCSFAAISSSLSLEELKAATSNEQTAALQRHFFYACDVLEKNGIDVENLIAALLGSAVQEYFEKAMLKHVESAKKRFSDIPPTYVATYEFMKAQGKMMANQGW